MDVKRKMTCCFTGHRAISRDEKELTSEMIKNTVRYLVRRGVRYFTVGGALGFDTVAAVYVHHLKATHPEVELHLVLPCRDQNKGWSTEDNRRYYAIMGVADSIHYIHDTYTRSCMKERNAYMVDHSTACICFYDENQPKTGTGQTVRMAKSKGLLTLNLYSACTESVEI
jgi:uncharacterized phage-like protein YoqJ